MQGAKRITDVFLGRMYNDVSVEEIKKLHQGNYRDWCSEYCQIGNLLLLTIGGEIFLSRFMARGHHYW